MQKAQTNSRPSRTRNRPVTQAVPIPQTRTECNELRDLLETNLLALHALMEEHQRTLDATLLAMDTMRGELRAELRALGDARAPWVHAVAETRALLYVALRELIVGNNEAGVSMKMKPQGERDDHRTR